MYCQIGIAKLGIHCHHKKRRRQDILLRGIVRAGQSCYSHPLLLPDLPVDHPQAMIHNYSEFAMLSDRDFAKAWLTGLVKAISDHHDRQFETLEQQLQYYNNITKRYIEE